MHDSYTSDKLASDMSCKQYLLKYYFDGYGEVVIDAYSEDDALQKFHSGEFDDEIETGTNYGVEHIFLRGVTDEQ